MSKRSKACEIPKAVRKEVWLRDGQRCIVCGCLKASPNAHYIPRSRGGLGIKENVVSLCMFCHHELDNGKNIEWYVEFVTKYLEELYPDFTDAQRIYDKWRV